MQDRNVLIDEDNHAALVGAALDTMHAYLRHNDQAAVKHWFVGRVTGLEQAAKTLAPLTHARRWDLWANMLATIVRTG